MVFRRSRLGACTRKAEKHKHIVDPSTLFRESQHRNGDLMHNMVEYAIEYAERGFKVHPLTWIVIDQVSGEKYCSCGDLSCRSQGKHPLLKSWQTQATTDTDQIKQWWQRNPHANIGWAVSPGWCVIDLDVKGKDLVYGSNGLDWYLANEMLLPNTATQLSPSGGKHLVYRLPVGVQVSNQVAKIAPCVDTRTDGGYILVAPSKALVDGKADAVDRKVEEYAWVDSVVDLEDTDIPFLPAFLLEEMSQQKERISAGGEYGTQRGRKNGIALTQEMADDMCSILGHKNSEGRPTFNPDEYGDWFTVGSAIFTRSSSEDAFDLWCTWSSVSPKFDEDHSRKMWDHHFDAYHPHAVTFATLAQRAIADGWKPTTNGSSVLSDQYLDSVVDLEEDEKIVAWEQDKDEAKFLHDDYAKSAGGVLQLYIDWCVACDKRGNYNLALASGISLFGTLFGRVFEFDEAKTNTFLLIVGESGQGKATARQCIKTVLNKHREDSSIPSTLPMLGPERFASGASFFKEMLEYPSRVFLLDEIGKQLDRIFSGKASGFEAEVEDAFLSFFPASSENPVSDKARMTKQITEKLAFPHMNIYATTTPNFYDSMSSATAVEGIFSRFLLFDITEEDREKQKKTASRLSAPDDVIAPIDMFLDWKKKYFLPKQGNMGGAEVPSSPVTFEVLGYSKQVGDMLEKLEEEQANRRKGANKIARAVWIRYREQIMKLAMIRRLSFWVTSKEIQREILPEIQVEDLRWAKGIVNWSTERMAFVMEAKTTEGKFDRVAKKVLEAVRRSGKDGITKTRLGKAVKEDPMVRDRALAELIKIGDVEQVKIMQKKGRPITKFKAIKIVRE